MNAPLENQAILTKELKSTDTFDQALVPRPLKIALLGYRSHPFVGGQGIYIRYLSRALKKLGHTVHVYSGQPYPDLDDNITLIKVPSLNLYESPNHILALRWKHMSSFTDFYEWWTMATGGFGEPYSFGRRVYKLLKTSDYDIIHDNQSLSTALLKLQKSGHNVLSTIHHPIHRDRDLALAEAQNRGHRLLIRRWHNFLSMQEKVSKKLKHIITVSKQSQSDIARHFGRDSLITPIIFNGVDTDLFRPSKHIEKSRFAILTTSSSDQALKGLKSLLLALHIVKKKQPLVKLHIVGKLKQNGSNQKLINELNLRAHIVFHSGLSTSELVALYNEVSAVVCPSLYEGFGLPAAEALACATCVISSDGGALPEVVSNAGIIYPANDHQALATAIEKIFSDPLLRQKFEQKGRDRALTHFCWDRVAQKLSGHYQTILSAKHGNS